MWCITENVVYPDCAGVWLFVIVLIIVLVVGVVAAALRDPYE